MSDATQRLAEIEARVAAATPGPWRTWNDGHVGCIDGHIGGIFAPTAGSQSYRRMPDARFVAHAREDVPWLIERLREAHTTIRALVGGDPR